MRTCPNFECLLYSAGKPTFYKTGVISYCLRVRAIEKLGRTIILPSFYYISLH